MAHVYAQTTHVNAHVNAIFGDFRDMPTANAEG